MQTTRLLALILALLAAICSPNAAMAATIFTDDLESGTLANWTTTVASPLTIATGTNRVPVGGNNSALIDSSADRMHRNIIADNGASEVSGHAVFSYWLYDAGVAGLRFFAEFRGYSGGTGLPNGGSTASGSLAQVLAFGKYNSVTLPGDTAYNGNKYQARAGFTTNSAIYWFNLDGAGSPNRSVGWHKFTMERDAGGSTVRFYIDGILSRTITDVVSESLDTVALGLGAGSSAGNGWLDGFEISSGVPTIVSNPAPETVVAGNSVTFRVADVGGITYQWTHAGTNIPGATNSSLTLNNVQAENAGQYAAIVGNSEGNTPSGEAALGVTPAPPFITAPPAHSTNCAGSTASFTVSATGEAPLTYQWYFESNTVLPDATNATAYVSNVAPANVGGYTVVVSNVGGSTTSTVAQLVLAAPTTASGPSNITACPGGSVVFTTVASGEGPFSYIWRKDGGAALSSTSNTLEIASVTLADAGVYAVEVTGACNSVTNSATLTVAPGITSAVGPDNTNTCAGTTLTLTTVASGTGPFTYVWRKDGGAALESTSNTLTFSPVVVGDAGTYAVEVSGACGSVTNTAAVMVSPAPSVAVNSATICTGGSAILTATTDAANPVFLWSPGGQTNQTVTNSPASTTTYTVTVTDGLTLCSAQGSGTITVQTNTTLTAIGNKTNCPASTVIFTTIASGTGPFTYVWRKDGGAALGETTDTLTLTGVTTADSGLYAVEVTGACNTATNSATLVVIATPNITAQPQNQATPMGNGAVFGVTATTMSSTLAPLSYQWETNGVDVTGANGTSLAISNLALSMNGTLVRVRVTNCAGTTMSLAATLTVTPVSGISFDFDTPGQFTNAPYYLTYNNWINSGFLSGGFANVPTYESSFGGVGPFPGSGSVDLHVNNNIDNTSILLPTSFDFSLAGKTLYAATMFKVKTPITAGRRATQFGFVTATNVGIADVTPQGFMSVIVQSPTANTPSFELRTQRRTSTGGLQESVVVPATTLTVSNWYRLSVTFTNTKNLSASNFAIVASLQDMGPLGTTPGAVAMSFTTTTNNADIVNFRNVYLALRSFEDGGVEQRDNTYAWTTPGNLFFVQEPQNQTVAQGDRAQFRSYVDGEGIYTYIWQRDDGIGGFTNVAFGGSWNYITPPARTTDNGAQFRLVVNGPANSVTSAPVTLTVTAETLAVVSAGSVDGTTVGVLFNQPVDPVTATNPANYTVDGVNPKHARVYRTSLGANGPEGIYVVLTPVNAVVGTVPVVVSGVQDLSGGTIGGANSAMATVAGLTGFDVNPLVTGPAGENYSFGPGQFIVSGGGADIFSGGDGFRYVYTTKTGDFDLAIRIPHMDTTRFTSKAGIDARISLDPFSPGVFAGFDPGPMGEGAGNVRQFAEGTAKQFWGAGGKSWGSTPRLFHPDVWVRFRRSGNTFQRYSSSNGTNWVYDGQINPTTTFPDTVYVGLAVCSARNLFATSAQFENFGDFAGYAGATIAITSPPTNFTVNAGSSFTQGAIATLTGGGAPASAGELAYVWQRSDGVGGFTNLPNSGLTNNTISLGPLFRSDDGAVFRVVVKAPGAADAVSSPFTATVNDSAPPTVTSANSGVYASYPVSEVLINFSELVSEATATNIANYLVTNAAGVQLNVLSVTILNGDPRNVLVIVDGELGFGTAFVRISGVQDLNGNTIASVLRNFRSYHPSTAPMVAEYYMDIGNVTTVAALTGHATYTAGQPSWISYSNMFGVNGGVAANFTSSTFPGVNFANGTVAMDNVGVKAYTYFVPPTNGAYKFWVRGDDAVQLFMNTNSAGSTNPLGKVLIAELTAANSAYSVGTTPANSRTNITLVAGQPYYMEVLQKETGGGDGFSITWTAPTVNTAPAQAAVISAANLAYPDAVAPKTPVVAEIYQGYTGTLVGNGTLPTLTSATNFPVGTVPFNNEWSANWKYIAGLPDHVSYQKYFGMQPQLGNTRVDNYLGRIISYFVAPTNGNYKFYMRADDSAQLYMNTNAVNSTDAAGKKLLGRLDAFTSAHTLVAQNVSLTGGQKYYLEALWREGGSGDGIAVAVRSQGDATAVPISPIPEVIPASLLQYPIAYGRAGAVNFDSILTTPAVEGQSVVMLPAGVKGSMLGGAGHGVSAGPGYGFIWLKNGVRVMENSFTNVTPPLTVADNGAVYTLIVTNQFSRAEHSITLSVAADTTAPVLQKIVGWRGADGFTMQFSEPMDASSVTHLGNYMANNGLGLLSATLDPTRRFVSVSTTPQIVGTNYNIMIMGVKDASAAGNALSTNVSFSTWGLGGKGILVELFTNLNGSTIGDLVGAPKFAANVPDVVYYTNTFSVGQFGADTGLQFYGARVTALFVPTNTGLYRFYLRQDDAAMLFLNYNATNSEDPNGKTMIHHSQGANISFLDARSISAPIPLNQGQPYYMEMLFKEGTGGDYALMTFRNTDAAGTALGAALVDTAAELANIANFGAVPGNPDAVAIASTPPSEIFVTESDLVPLCVVASVPANTLPYITYTWQKFDGVGYTNIPGATLSCYNFYANCADDGAIYRLVLSAPGRDFTFDTLVHVDTDLTPPFLVSASTLDGNTIGLLFNEPPDPTTGNEAGNYQVNGGAVTVSAAQIRTDVDPRTVVLTLQNPVFGDFTVDVFSMADRACNPNFADSSITGTYQGLFGMDVGGPLAVGSSFSYTNGIIEVTAGGADIWGASDQGHITVSQRSGDFDVWTRVDSLLRTSADTITKAGLVIRETTNADSRALTFLGNPSAVLGGRDLVEVGYRTNTAANTGPWSFGPSFTPFGIPNAWVRLKRTGNFFSAFRSTNGVDWILQGTNAAAFPRTVWVGLGSTAHNNAAPPTLAVYKDIHLPSPPVITTQPSPGAQSIPLNGSVSYTVVASNPPNAGSLTYRWRRDGMTIVSTADTLNITDARGVDSGVYTVEVGNDGGTVFSDAVTLVVNNGLPTNGGDSLSATQGIATAVSAATLLSNDSDPEGSNLTFLAVSGFTPVTVATNFAQGNLSGASLYGSHQPQALTGVIEDGALVLTKNNTVNSQSGAMVINDFTGGKRVGGFTASFKLLIGDGSGQPADGFSFNFAADLPDAAGQTFGENGVGTGFSFCVDNYQFAPFPAGGTPFTSGMKIRFNNTNIAGVQLAGAWNTLAFVPVTITLANNGFLTVNVDGTNAFALQLPAALNTAGRFGFYARTGGEREATFIDDLSITALTSETPNGGTVGISGADVTYNPGTNCGSDSFYYVTSDGEVNGSGLGLVSVSVAPSAPVITTCATNITISAAAGCVANLPDLTVASGLVYVSCGGDATVTQNPVAGTSVPLGPNVVTITVSNATGIATCEATVTVIDNVAPAVNCPANIIAEATSAAGRVVTFTPTALDNCDGAPVIVSSPASGSTFPIGVTTVTVSANDASGNTNTCTFTVTVRDTTGPAIDCPTNRTVVCSGTNATATYSASATDLVDANPTVLLDPPSDSNFPVGTNTVTVTAYDAAGNTNTCTFLVIVEDPSQPRLTITRSISNVTICWPQSCTPYVLEGTPSMEPVVIWTAITNVPDLSGTNFCVTLPADETKKFFRLQKP